MIGGIVEALWNDYKSRVIHPDAGELQLKETKRAFFGGVHSFFIFIQENANTDATGPDKNTVEWVDQIGNELNQFVQDVLDNRA